MSASFSPQETRRLARYRAWVLAATVWLIRIFGVAAPARHARQRGGVTLARLERMTRNLVIVHAAALMPPAPDPRTRKRYGPHARRCCSKRAIAGAFLRRKLKRRAPMHERLAHLANVLSALDTLAAQFARHRRRGLSRLAPRPRPPLGFAMAPSALAWVPAAPDSS